MSCCAETKDTTVHSIGAENGRIQEQIADQIGDIRVAQIVEDTAEVMHIIPQEHLQRHTVNHEQIIAGETAQNVVGIILCDNK